VERLDKEQAKVLEVVVVFVVQMALILVEMVPQSVGWVVLISTLPIME
jgi:hypothetical protein